VLVLGRRGAWRVAGGGWRVVRAQRRSRRKPKTESRRE
jgi:hypothetical protein